METSEIPRSHQRQADDACILARQCDDIGFSDLVFVVIVLKIPRLLRTAAAVCFCFSIVACGYRGALYLPDQPPASEQQQPENEDPSVPETDNEPN